MVYETNTYVERVLITLNPDGSFRGAHQERLSQVLRDGEVIGERQEPAEPLTAEALISVLPDAAASLAQVAALTDGRG
jgi:hypothetical protein